MERVGSFSVSKRQIASNSKKLKADMPPEATTLSKEELLDKYVSNNYSALNEVPK